MNKESQLARAKEDRVKVAMAQGQKQVWFRDRINEEDLLEQKSWTIEQLAKLVDEYLQRNDDEIEDIESGRVKGRALAPKDALLLQIMETEQKDAKLGGIEVPDLTSAFMAKTLRSWDGDVNSVSTIKLINCKPSDQQPKRRDVGASTKSAEQAIAQATGMTVG
ncbi:translation machinery-associated protein 16 [Coemansia sp. RSA 1365]|nr:translation machinery-associated protein 16 [Coemansia sp. RSA 1365]